MTESFFKDEGQQEKPTEIPDLDEGAERPRKTEKTEAFSTDEGRIAAIMAYIPILCFVPLLNMRENKEAMFHAKQGVLLFIIELVALLFLIDSISDLVFKGILLLAIALSVVGVYFAFQGKNYKLPIIGDLADKSKF